MTKTLLRPACERRMSLIVDDTVDVWANDLANLCITRRFVGDQLDDGLQLLSWQLEAAHRAFFADSPAEGYSYSPALAAPPSVFSVLADARGQLLAGCSIALTGVVNGLGHEDGLEQVPLAVLIKLYGGALTTSLEHATHLVARRKDGWQNSPKIRKALARVQARDPCCAAPSPPPPTHTCPVPHTHAAAHTAAACPHRSRFGGRRFSAPRLSTLQCTITDPRHTRGRKVRIRPQGGRRLCYSVRPRALACRPAPCAAIAARDRPIAGGP